MVITVKLYADRLRSLRLQKGLSQDQLASLLKISRSAVGMYETGQREPDFETGEAIADIFNVDMDYLIGRSDIPRKGDIIPPGFDPLPLMRKVPLIGQIACGEPITAEENIADYVDVPAQYHCDFCLKCIGDSMIEANINDGDIVYIRKQPTVENGDIAAVRIGDEATLKRVYLDGDCVVLAPANSKYPPRSYRGQELEDIHIEGKAVGFTHWF